MTFDRRGSRLARSARFVWKLITMSARARRPGAHRHAVGQGLVQHVVEALRRAEQRERRPRLDPQLLGQRRPGVARPASRSARGETASRTSSRDARHAGKMEARSPNTADMMQKAISHRYGMSTLAVSMSSRKRQREGGSRRRGRARCRGTCRACAMSTDSRLHHRPAPARRFMPTARSSPSSRVRSMTDSASVIAMPRKPMSTDRASSTRTKLSAMGEAARSACSWISSTSCTVDVG